MAFSRLYLGVHYASDVIAGLLAGVAWVAVCVFGARGASPPHWRSIACLSRKTRKGQELEDIGRRWPSESSASSSAASPSTTG